MKHTDEERRLYYEYLYSFEGAPKIKDVPESDFDAIASTTAGHSIKFDIAMSKLWDAVLVSLGVKS